jgi:hypothetical protein
MMRDDDDDDAMVAVGVAVAALVGILNDQVTSASPCMIYVHYALCSHYIYLAGAACWQH